MHLTKLIEKLNHERKNAIKNGIYHLIQIKFSYNSNRIEGSGLTYEQTAHIFDKSVLITEKNANIKLDDIFETINHFECVNYLLESCEEPLSLEYFKTLQIQKRSFLILTAHTHDYNFSRFLSFDCV
ncbi:hypothetical protein VPL84_00120, partial [Helicobacter pylori]